MQVFDKEIIKEKCKCLIMCEKCVFMLWEQGVEGSNPFAPTIKTKKKGMEIPIPFLISEIQRIIPSDPRFRLPERSSSPKRCRSSCWFRWHTSGSSR